MTEPLSATELHELAKELAYVNAESLSLDPIRATRAERLLSDGVLRLLADRDELIEVLMEVINQACQVSYVDGRGRVVDPMSSTTYEDALRLLERLGYARPLSGGRFELVWPERKGE